MLSKLIGFLEIAECVVLLKRMAITKRPMHVRLREACLVNKGALKKARLLRLPEETFHCFAARTAMSKRHFER